MSFLHRMGAPVGNTQSVGLYLFDKIAHVSFITFMLYLASFIRGPWHGWFAPDMMLYIAGTIAAFAYTGIGKVLWHLHHPEDPFTWSDLVFDWWVVQYIPVMATMLFMPSYTLILLGIWLLGLLAGSNNAIGSPS